MRTPRLFALVCAIIGILFGNPSPVMAQAATVEASPFLGTWNLSFSGVCHTCRDKTDGGAGVLTLEYKDANVTGQFNLDGKLHPLTNVSVREGWINFHLSVVGRTGSGLYRLSYSLRPTNNVLEGVFSQDRADTGASWRGSARAERVGRFPTVSASIADPGADVSASTKAFSGRWEGTAKDGQPRLVAVLAIYADGRAQVKQAWGGMAPQLNAGRVFNYSARIEGNRLVMQGSIHRYEFELAPDGTLRGGFIGPTGSEDAVLTRR